MKRKRRIKKNKGKAKEISTKEGPQGGRRAKN
jgi:hypothetical protein